MKSLGNFDCIVVGGGPVGAVAARSAARQGLKVLLAEKGETPTYSDRCTGIVSLRFVKEAEIDNAVVLREIRGGAIYAPNGKSVSIEAEETRALVIDRHLLNVKLLEMAQMAGVKFIPYSRVVGLDNRSVIIERKDANYQVKTKVVIGADGPKSKVAQWAKLPAPSQFFLGLQATVRHETERPDFIEVYLDQDLAPGFFAWVVPAEEGIARVGLATYHIKGASSYLKKFLDKFNFKPLKINAGLIPIGPRAKTIAEGVMVVGDAAAQAKPTSGGGLYTGIVAAKIAGQVAADHIYNYHDLLKYEKGWREKFDRELSFGMSLRSLFIHLRNHELNLIFSILDNNDILDIIKTYGDIDYPSLIIKALLQQPKEWWKVWKSLQNKLITIPHLLKPTI